MRDPLLRQFASHKGEQATMTDGRPADSCAQAMVTAALAYAARVSWAVLPLRGKASAIPKHQPGGRGYLDATTDLGVIRERWTRFPGSGAIYSSYWNWTEATQRLRERRAFGNGEDEA